MTVITIPKILTDKLTEAGAQALVDMLNKVEENASTQTLKMVEDRFEKRLAQEIGGLRADIIRWMFVFWIGQAATVIGFISIFFKQ